MAANQFSEIERRVLLVAPTRRDAEITSSLLARAGLTCVVCADFRELRREASAGAGAILATGEAVADAGVAELLAALAEQPTWSDLPVILLVKGGDQATIASRVIASLRNVTLLERPAPTRSVISAVEAAVRGRLRQYHCATSWPRCSVSRRAAANSRRN